MTESEHCFQRPLPQGLEGLVDLALDLRWSWNHATDKLWERIDPETWDITRNPWVILQTVSTTRLEELAVDPDFRSFMKDMLTAHEKAIQGDAWFHQAYPQSRLSVAYFSMEFGLSEALPLYSGGLGVLAGDYLKTASDLGVPVIGVGLLYQQGYFRQALDAQGAQIEFYPFNDPSQLPVQPVRDPHGEWLRVKLDFPGRNLWLRIWEARVGRVKLYLLDSNDPINSPADRGITSELYGGSSELRLQQEIVLGIGGWRMLHSMGGEMKICHLNEGHAALAVMERARLYMEFSGQPFNVALSATRAGNIFTTHTPVEAGFDVFNPGLVDHYFRKYADILGIGTPGLLALGRKDPDNLQEPFSMAYLALRGSGNANGVSRLHGEVSRRIFQPLFPRWPQAEVPVTCVTNGVHMPSWDSEAADKLWSDACGKDRWLGTLDNILYDLKKVSDEVVWEFRMSQSRQLVQYVRERQVRQFAPPGHTSHSINEYEQVLDPNALTIGFARRFASYKRPNMLLHDPERLARILNHRQRPVQLIIAGKAHPHDSDGKTMIQAWLQFLSRQDIRSHAIFIADYDMAVAEQLVQGVDLWINTPRRPWEACGTSGMKVLVNGGLNLSERDGWWAEAYRPEVGWALGDGQEHDDADWDRQEAEQLYHLLEEEIIPCFYERDNRGIPVAWIARMRTSMAELTPQFSANRMLREYIDRLYINAMQTYDERISEGSGKAAILCQWHDLLDRHWNKLYFGKLDMQKGKDSYIFTVPVYLDELDPKMVQVQLYADPTGSTGPEIYNMEMTKALSSSQNGYLYNISIPVRRPAEHYTPRIIPYYKGAIVPLEANHILWYEP